MTMKKLLLLLSLLLVFVAVGYYFGSQKEAVQKPRQVLELLDLNCNPAKSVCTAGKQDISVRLFFPEQVHYLKPFRMQVTTKGIGNSSIETIYINYTMVGMDMGLNRFNLKSVTDAKGQQRYEGEGILPVCVSGRVDWLANVNVVTADKVYEAVFKLEVTK
jgi:hypothetical protein